ncbi:MAG: T9SS type A sorting domain-containing protein [Saprospiraceae bacterium]|nr:MAG: T9SS type A sorting domain-containing protein [Saprospiraceae bacterium]
MKRKLLPTLTAHTHFLSLKSLFFIPIVLIVQVSIPFDNLFGQKSIFAKQKVLSEEVRSAVQSKIEKQSFKAFSLDLKALNDFLKSNTGNQMEFSLIFGNDYQWSLTLDENDIRQLPGRPNFNCNTYKGIANRSLNNTVRLYVSGNFIQGFITEGDKRIYLRSLNSLTKSGGNDIVILYESPHFAPNSTERTTTCDDVNVELGIHGDYQLYLDHGSNEQNVIQEIFSLVNMVEDFYSSQLNLNFHIIVRGTENGDPIVWKTQDPFCCQDIVPLFDVMNSEWVMHRPCIPKDAIFLIAAKNYYAGGQASGQVCNNPSGDVDVAFIDEFFAANSNPAFRFAHELGHLLGATELEYTSCSGLCNNPNLTPLMCTDGVSLNDINAAFLSQCTLDEIWLTINNNCEDCLAPPPPLPSCAICFETAMITADNMQPIPGCGGKDIINYTVTICNSCDPQNLEVRVNFNGNRFDYLPPSDFPTIEDVSSPPLNSQQLVTTVNFNGQECKEFHFALKLKETPSGPGLGTASAVHINGNSLPTQPLSHITILVPDFVEIDGSDPNNPASLQALVLSSTLDNTPCDGIAPFITQIELTGHLNIDIPSYCFNNYLFKMNPGAKILVESGNTLTIKNGTRIFGCEELWQSIEVEDGAILIIDNSTIEDAQYAVRAYGGGNLSITNSTFNRNFAGVLVDGPIPYYPENTTFDAFYGNTFDGGSGLLPAPANLPPNPALPSNNGTAFAGVWIQTKANPLNSLNNVFKNLSNGIYANGTSLKITKNQFTNIWENGYDDWMAGYGIRAKDYTFSHNFQQTGFGKDAEPLSFSLCSKAIRIEGMRVDYIAHNNIRANKGIELIANYPKAVVINNRIESWITGVELSQVNNASDVWVSLNDIEVAGVKGVGIQSNMMNLGPVSDIGLNISLNNVILKAGNTKGVELNANNSSHVMENKISANIGLSGYTGIRVNNDERSDLSCNEVTASFTNYNKTMGIALWDGYLTHQMCNRVSYMSKGVYFTMGGFAPERFQETTFESNEVGLQLSASATIGPQTNNGNIWQGTFGSYGAQHLSPYSEDWTASRFTVHTSTPSTYRPSLPPGQDQWFPFDPSGSPSADCQLLTSCITELPPLPVDGLYGIDTTITSRNFQTTDFVGVTNWLARRYLYGKLANNPGLIAPGSVFESFYNSTAASAVGSFDAIEAGMEVLYEIPAQTAAGLGAGFDTMSVRMEEIGGIDSLLQSAGYDSTLVQQRAAAMQILQGAEESGDSLMQPVLNQRISNAAVLASQNTTITADSVFELNERTVKHIYLNTVAIGITEFDEMQLADLESIAGQCPLTGGSAVFKARSLLAMVQDSLYDDETLCQQIGERNDRSLDNNDSSFFNLFPNPAKNEVTASFSSSSELSREIVLSDATGKEIWRKEVPKAHHSVVFETTGIQPGVYFCTLFENDVKAGVGKLIIIH